MNSVCVNLALPKCAERGCSHDRRLHLGDYGNQSDGNNTQCKKERPLLLALGVREYRLALLRPLARTLQPCRTGCCSACFCGMGNSCLEKEKPLGVRGAFDIIRQIQTCLSVRFCGSVRHHLFPSSRGKFRCKGSAPVFCRC